MKTDRIIIALLLLFPSFSLAAEAHEAGHAGVPWGSVITQVINVVLVIALLTYLLRKKSADHFQQRQEGYNALLNKAEEARKEAEENRRQISERLTKLEQNAQASLVQARTEAQELKTKILADAKNLSQKLEDEARRTVEFEVQRAREILRQELLSAAVDDAHTSMEKSVKDPDLKRLQNEFVQRVQVVRP
jgi:F-type H+-transporting ATPase subunit b